MTNVDVTTVVILTLALTLYALALLPIRLFRRRSTDDPDNRSVSHAGKPAGEPAGEPVGKRRSIPHPMRRAARSTASETAFPVVPPFDPALTDDTMPVSFIVSDAQTPESGERRDLAFALYLDLRHHPDESLALTANDGKYQAELEGTHLHLGRPPSDAELQTLTLRLADAILAILHEGRGDDHALIDSHRTRWIEITPATLEAQLRRMGLPPAEEHILERAARVALGFQFQKPSQW